MSILRSRDSFASLLVILLIGSLILSSPRLLSAQAPSPPTSVDPDPLAPVLDQLARLERMGSYDRALDLLKQAPRPADPKDVRIELLRAKFHRLIGTPESRVQSIRYIEYALKKNPTDPLANFEMALTRYEQTFYGEAKSYFRKALRIDPTLAEARFYLGRLIIDNWRRLPTDSHELARAALEFREAARHSPDDPRILYSLAVSQYFQKDYQGSRKTLEHLVTIKSRHADGHLLLGLVHHQSGRLELAEQHYKRGIGYLNLEDRQVFRNIGILMTEGERKRYERLEFADQQEERRLFWLERDPTPVTRLNERVLDHYKRCVISDLLYALPRLGMRGWETHRGQVFVRYGPPIRQIYDLQGGLSGGTWMWIYPDVGNDPFRFTFVNEFLNGNFIFPIMEGDWRENYDNFERVTELYKFRSETTYFSLFQDLAQFRGTEGQTRVEFYSAIPKNSAEHEVYTISPDPVDHLEGTLVLYDKDWRELERKRWSSTIADLGHIDHLDSSFSVSSIGVELPAGRYNYLIHYADTLLQSEGFHRGDLTVRAFETPLLDVSEIQIARDVSFSEGSPLFQKGALSVLPNPLTRTAADIPVSFYYEIYNLSRDSEDLSHFLVTYSVTTPEALHPEEHFDFFRQFKEAWAALRGREYVEAPIISSSTRQTRLDERSQEYLYVDVGRLVPGEYILVLEIEDLQTGESAIREKPFTIAERGR